MRHPYKHTELPSVTPRAARLMSASKRPGSHADAVLLERGRDLVEGCRIVDGGGQVPGIAVGDLFHGAAQDLAGPGLWQTRDGERDLESRDRADLLAHEAHDLLLDLVRRTIDAGLEHHEPARHLALEV